MCWYTILADSVYEKVLYENRILFTAALQTFSTSVEEGLLSSCSIVSVVLADIGDTV